MALKSGVDVDHKKDYIMVEQIKGVK